MHPTPWIGTSCWPNNPTKAAPLSHGCWWFWWLKPCSHFMHLSFPSILQGLWNLNIFLASGPPLPHRTHTLCHIKFKGHESTGDILKFACNLCRRFRMSIWMPQLQQQFNWLYAKLRFLPIYSKTTLSLPTCLVLGLKDPPQSCGTWLGEPGHRGAFLLEKATRWHISTNRKTNSPIDTSFFHFFRVYAVVCVFLGGLLGRKNKHNQSVGSMPRWTVLITETTASSTKDRLVSVAPPDVPMSAACGAAAVPWEGLLGKKVHSWVKNTKQTKWMVSTSHLEFFMDQIS